MGSWFKKWLITLHHVQLDKQGRKNFSEVLLWKKMLASNMTFNKTSSFQIKKGR